VEHFGGVGLVFLFQDLFQKVKLNALPLLSSAQKQNIRRSVVIA
jgi:hypothetical protein